MPPYFLRAGFDFASLRPPPPPCTHLLIGRTDGRTNLSARSAAADPTSSNEQSGVCDKSARGQIAIANPGSSRWRERVGEMYVVSTDWIELIISSLALLRISRKGKKASHYIGILFDLPYSTGWRPLSGEPKRVYGPL